MKNQLLGIFLIGTILLGTNAWAQDINVPKEKKTFIVKLTADWCGPCGGWGWQWFDSMIHEYNNGSLKGLPVAVHTSSSTNPDLNFTGWGSFSANFTRSMVGIPTFSIGHKSDVGRMDAMRKETASQTAGPAIVNTGFRYKVTGDTMAIDTKTKFFYDGNGEHYVAVYVYEEGIVSYQYPRGDSAEHHKVLRRIPGEPVFGKKLPGAFFSAGKVFEDSLKFAIPSTWNKEELHIFTVTWNKIGDHYVVANMNEVPTFPVGIGKQNRTINSIILYPSPASNNVTIGLNLMSTSSIRVNVMDLSGRIVYGTTTEMNQGHNTHRINTSSLANGIYNVSIIASEAVYTQQFIVNH